MPELRIVRAADLSPDTAQTPGMTRIAAVDRNSTGCEKLMHDAAVTSHSREHERRPSDLVRRIDLSAVLAERLDRIRMPLR